jgi:DNA-binding transcriptional regulator YhcF (GntR family)
LHRPYKGRLLARRLKVGTEILQRITISSSRARAAVCFLLVTVDKALNELIEWGMIKKYRNFKDHIQQPNDYIIQDLKHRDFKFYLVKKTISEEDFR